VGFIPRKERDHECNDSDDQGQVLHQQLPKYLGAQNDARSSPASMNSRQESRVWTPLGLQNGPFRHTTDRKS
jgi:hypothetical protein